jgi:hypothetical protein
MTAGVQWTFQAPSTRCIGILTSYFSTAEFGIVQETDAVISAVVASGPGGAASPRRAW